MPRIKAVSVVRSFEDIGGPKALRGISLSIEPGEFVAIEGPSGGGKSTLLNVLGLLDQPDAGHLTLGEKSLDGLSDDQITRLRSDTFGFVFQSFHLLDFRPAIESVELGLLYRGIPAAERRARALTALENVGLGAAAFQRANTLSGGERQRIAIARALASQAPVVLADEPTGNLDSENSVSVVKALTDLNRSGTTVLLVTHEDSVAQHAKRRIRIRDGGIQSDSAVQGSPPPTSAQVGVLNVPGHASTLRRRDLWTDAARSVRSRASRSRGLVAAVSLAVALTVATVGISLSARSQVSDSFDARLNRDVTVTSYASQAHAEPGLAPSEVLDALRALSGVDAAGLLDDLGGASVQVLSTRPVVTAREFAVYGDLFMAARTTVTWASGHGALLTSDEVVLGYQLATTLELGPLDSQPTITLEGRDVRVVGIVEDSPREPELVGSVVVAGGPDVREAQSRAAVILTVVGAAQQVARQAPLVLDPYEPSRLEVHAPVDPNDLRNEIEQSVQLTLLVVSLVALFGAVAGLANAMMLSVGDRSHEIGLRRALGARRRHVSMLISAESAIIGTLGGLLGLAVGFAAILATTIANRWVPVFDLRLAPLAIVGGVVVGAVGGLFAARRAARIEPQQALRL